MPKSGRVRGAERPLRPGLLPSPALLVRLILRHRQHLQLPDTTISANFASVASSSSLIVIDLLDCLRLWSLPLALLCLPVTNPRSAWCSGALGAPDNDRGALGAGGRLNLILSRAYGYLVLVGRYRVGLKIAQ